MTLSRVAAHARHRKLIVILDGKRNDIGTTAQAYAQAYLEKQPEDVASLRENWCCDALTVTPYLGSDGVEPFINVATQSNDGLFVLVRTSNPSAREFQDLMCEGKPVYRHVAERVRDWAAPHCGESGYSFVGAVVGATYPQELAELRAVMPCVPFLVPGYGTQGGTAADVAGAFDASGTGAVVNNSRGIVFAYRDPKHRDRFGPGNWQRAIEAALDDMIADLAANTPAGRLRA
jgi:orotidine-5'-phosphate decarboxylase